MKHNQGGGSLEPERLGCYDLLYSIASSSDEDLYVARSRAASGSRPNVALRSLPYSHLDIATDELDEVLRDMRLTCRIKHTNVVEVLDVDNHLDGVSVVTEYVEGESLAGLRRMLATADQQIDVRVGLRIVHDALSGLHAIHETNDARGEPLELLHGRFSPHCMLVGLDGVARLTGTADALVKETKIQYMSPEQARGEPFDRHSDVWAAGVVVWETLAGRRLYRGDDDSAALLEMITKTPPPPSSAGKTIPQPLEQIVARALAPHPEDRFSTAKELADTVEQAARSIGGLATRKEVAKLVDRLVGRDIDARREELAEVLTRCRKLDDADADAEDTETTAPTQTPEQLGDDALKGAEGSANSKAPRTLAASSRPPPTNRQNLRLVIGTAVVAVMLAVGVTTAWNPAPPPETTPIVVRTGNAPWQTPRTPSPAKPARTSTRSFIRQGPEVAPPLRVAVTADVNVAEVHIGNHVTKVTPQAKTFDIELPRDSSQLAQVIIGIDVDGRPTAVTWNPGDDEIRLRFMRRRATPAEKSTRDPSR